jgi:hypothetical protein
MTGLRVWARSKIERTAIGGKKRGGQPRLTENLDCTPLFDSDLSYDLKTIVSVDDRPTISLAPKIGTCKP